MGINRNIHPWKRKLIRNYLGFISKVKESPKPDMRIVSLGSGGTILDLDWFLK
jgi:hypothetical protein